LGGITLGARDLFLRWPLDFLLRIAIDARSAFAGRRTGVGYYTWHLVRLLPRVDPSSKYLAWYLGAPGARHPASHGRIVEHGPGNLIERRMPIPSPWFHEMEMRFDLPRIEWMARFDVLLAPNFVPPPTRAPRLVLTVHDLAFRLFPDTAPLATRRWLARLEDALRRASRVIVVSEQTRRDLLGLYPVEPDRVCVVGLGVDPEVFKPAPPAAVDGARTRFGIGGPYVLCLAGIEPRKNLPALIRAYATLPEALRPVLVLAGPVAPWNPEGWNLLRPVLDDLPSEVRSRIVLTGYVEEEDKVALLSGAEALVFPSLYEGFGLPVVEAMACGVPVLTSNVSALPETAGDAALLVDPLDVQDIAHGIEQILTDEELRERLRKAGPVRAAEFSWEETARRTAEVLHQVGVEPGRASRTGAGGRPPS
jgi:glycosyltransferase involved in cell wall biosynthesis